MQYDTPEKHESAPFSTLIHANASVIVFRDTVPCGALWRRAALYGAVRCRLTPRRTADIPREQFPLSILIAFSRHPRENVADMSRGKRACRTKMLQGCYEEIAPVDKLMAPHGVEEHLDAVATSVGRKVNANQLARRRRCVLRAAGNRLVIFTIRARPKNPNSSHLQLYCVVTAGRTKRHRRRSANARLYCTYYCARCV